MSRQIGSLSPRSTRSRTRSRADGSSGDSSPSVTLSRNVTSLHVMVPRLSESQLSGSHRSSSHASSHEEATTSESQFLNTPPPPPSSPVVSTPSFETILFEATNIPGETGASAAGMEEDFPSERTGPSPRLNEEVSKKERDDEVEEKRRRLHGTGSSVSSLRTFRRTSRGFAFGEEVTPQPGLLVGPTPMPASTITCTSPLTVEVGVNPSASLEAVRSQEVVLPLREVPLSSTQHTSSAARNSGLVITVRPPSTSSSVAAVRPEARQPLSSLASPVVDVGIPASNTGETTVAATFGDLPPVMVPNMILEGEPSTPTNPIARPQPVRGDAPVEVSGEGDAHRRPGAYPPPTPLDILPSLPRIFGASVGRREHHPSEVLPLWRHAPSMMHNTNHVGPRPLVASWYSRWMIDRHTPYSFPELGFVSSFISPVIKSTAFHSITYFFLQVTQLTPIELSSVLMLASGALIYIELQFLMLCAFRQFNHLPLDAPTVRLRGELAARQMQRRPGSDPHNLLDLQHEIRHIVTQQRLSGWYNLFIDAFYLNMPPYRRF